MEPALPKLETRNPKLPFSHSVVVRPPATFRRNPRDDLIGIHDVASFAMDAVGEVHVNLFAAWYVGGFDHFVDLRRAEVLAGVAILDCAARVADVGVVNDQMNGLIFFVLGAGMIDVGELVER